MLKEACGIFGVANHPNAAALTRLGLFALQHRGQESAGIMVLRQGKCELQKGMGLVADVFDRLPREWWKQPQQMAIGHVRYSTYGGSNVANAQPFVVEFDKWRLGLAHNGTLSDAAHWRNHLKRGGSLFQGDLDTEIILHIAAHHHKAGDLPWDALEYALKNIEGAYSIVGLCEDGMIAARDPFGFRPLCMGKLDDTVIFASETSALDIVGAKYVRDIEPGEIVHVSNDGNIRSKFFAFSKKRAHCIFELVYFSRPDSRVFTESVYEIRKNFGRQLAKECPVKADIVVPVPDSGMYAALGYSEASGIPFDLGIMRNHYVGRTFIKPSPEDRKTAVNMKLNPIREAIDGKSVCLVEDSIVRGNTSKERVRTLRENGAKEVHMRISCPPHIQPCYFGIDFPSADELIANNSTVAEIAKIIDADTLEYLSLDGMLSCVRKTKSADYCHACFSGDYPVKPKL
ncbi:MAG TPA: amidophosphoribosyltransferase [Lentisphaeria bacterium]|nr:MAG: amidophosphoribosyltransferase [Lentisphaerae bacterium GWF2_50_93]HCE46085.1 amidophosphoribosyltransferase [Lentisphaeria bacterium]